MAYTIIEQGDGYTIARDSEAHSTVPYAPRDRESGNRNYGFVDLADRPELAAEIPEAQRSAGLLRLLQTVNSFGSQFRTLGCECGLFPKDPPQLGYDRYIGSYIAITFREPELNSAERIESLARLMLARVAVEDTSHRISYEITVTPLRGLFGLAGCFELHVNALGYGRSDEEAWAAFDTACKGVAHAFDQLNVLQHDDPVFN